jgi:hypothetical protein
VTVDSGDLVLGLDGVSTATSDVYVYIDSNDFAGSNTGFNGIHTLPYAADYVFDVGFNCHDGSLKKCTDEPVLSATTT